MLGKLVRGKWIRHNRKRNGNDVMLLRTWKNRFEFVNCVWLNSLIQMQAYRSICLQCWMYFPLFQHNRIDTHTRTHAYTTIAYMHTYGSCSPFSSLTHNFLFTSSIAITFSLSLIFTAHFICVLSFCPLDSLYQSDDSKKKVHGKPTHTYQKRKRKMNEDTLKHT